MPKDLEMYAALANIESGPERNTLLQTLHSQVADFDLYKFNMRPGEAYMSLNWKGVLGTTAELAAVASLVWQVYVDQTRHKEPSRNQYCMIQVKDYQGNFEIFKVNCFTYKDEQEFVRDFTARVDQLRQAPSIDDRSVKAHTEASGQWIPAGRPRETPLLPRKPCSGKKE